MKVVATTEKVVFRSNRFDLNTIFCNFLLICCEKTHEICEIMTQTERFNLSFGYEKEEIWQMKKLEQQKRLTVKNYICIFFKDEL